MKILLVEDETHKRDEIINCIKSVLNLSPQVVDSVNSAILSIIDNEYDLIILDMALSTFGENSEDNKKGHDQSQGGVEVLRALKSYNRSTKIIIVTQYPDFYISNKKVKLNKSKEIIREKYAQEIIGTILYTYKSKDTLQKLASCLRNTL
ncbi:response regulator [Vibrio tritonius]|uniref:Response regulator n=1 Tax=Vibrio tritonius TaxID=1435069 RepID=A0ABS7YNU5_9VIBR|nr:response regulator [Vibrio tritonius]MCA2017351.1 response regulator [Vibrio tritonius]